MTVYACLRGPRRLGFVLAVAVAATLTWPFPAPAPAAAGSRWHARVVAADRVYPNGVRVSTGVGKGLTPGQDPATATASAVVACTPGYTCVYQDINYGGRRLEWQDPGQLINLADYDFNDQLSSWRNLNSEAAIWYVAADGLGLAHCMAVGASNPWVGSSDNDQASSLRILTRSTC